MASLKPAPRRSEAFAESLERTVDRLVVGPLYRPGAALRGLAASLQAAPIGPSADFRDALRTRLVAVAAVSPVAVPTGSPGQRLLEWSAGWRIQRSLRTATAGLATVVAISGVGLAGGRSLPGDPLYSVKRATEGVQLALAHGEVARGVRHLQFARERLREIERLSGYHAPSGASGFSADAVAFDGERASRIASALRDMDLQTDAGARLLTSAFVVHHNMAALRTLNAFSTSQADRLQGVLATLDAEEQPQAINSLSLVFTVQQRATMLLSSAPLDPAAADGPVDSALGPPVLTPPTPAPTTTSQPHHTFAQTTAGNGQRDGRHSTDIAQPAPAPTSSNKSTPPPADDDSDDQASSPPAQPSRSPSPTAAPTIVVTVPAPVPTTCVPVPLLPTICVEPA